MISTLINLLGSFYESKEFGKAESIAHSIHHCGVFLASSKVKDWAAEAVVFGGVNPAGSHPFGGFL